jgi:hypothetical protein
MTRFFRQFTGLGATFALLGALVATGCGQTPRSFAPGMRADMLSAKRTGYAVRFQPRPQVRNLREPLPGSTMHGLEDEDGDAPKDEPAAPAAPSAGGGLKPLPKPTPTAPPKAPAAPGEPDEVDELLTVLQNFGYNGNRKQMVRDLQARMFGYPIKSEKTPFGWDPTVNADEHYEWWKRTLPPDETGSLQEYKEQSLLIAQNKFDVVYYVWISKQYNPEEMKKEGRTSPFINLNEGLPVVKGIYGGGWLVELSPRNTILDYLKIPEQYLKDYNHLVRIPEDLYF